MATLYDEYLSVVQAFRQAYGDKLLVLFEVGNFYEWYDCNLHLGCAVKAVCDILQVQATRRNKTVESISRANPEMGGFPKASLPKYLPPLLEAHFTVVVVSQTSPPPNPKREVTSVISKGTYLDGITQSVCCGGGAPSAPPRSFALACIFMDAVSPDFTAVGSACVDASTGQAIVTEVHYHGERESESGESNCTLYDDARRLMAKYEPMEVVLLSDVANRGLAASLRAFVQKTSASCQVHDWTDTATARRYIGDIQAQNAMLRRIYPSTGFLTPLEHCNLERKPAGATAFSVLADFCFQHNEAILSRIDAPTVLEQDGMLALQHNGLVQLDVLPKTLDDAGAGRSLLQLLDRTVTPMGRRFLKHCLLHPISDAEELCRRYDVIDKMMERINATGETARNAPERAFARVRHVLACAYDVQRIARKIKLNKVQPKEISMVIDSVGALMRLLESDPHVVEACAHAGTPACERVDASGLARIKDFLAATFELSELPRAHSARDASRNIFQPGVFPIVDALFETMRACRNVFVRVVNKLNNMHGPAVFKLECADIGAELSITTTAKRFAAAHDAVAKLPDDLAKITGQWGVLNDGDPDVDGPDWTVYHCEIAQIKAGGSSSSLVMLDHPVLTVAAGRARRARRSLNVELEASFLKVIEAIDTQFGSALPEAARVLTLLDFFSTCAMNAHDMKHVRPSVAPDPDEAHAVLQGLRHPIIEMTNDKVPHIANDVSIGMAAARGLLLYGVNASGKSSLMKACGIAVLMAQCGMFVAASSMDLSPYTRLMTRIMSQDNIFAGQSTFMSEVAELRDIVLRCDARSLVLGDEVCSGTESVSATSIVGAVLQKLTDTKSSYIFATHLHELCGIPSVHGLPGLQVFHLSVRADPATGHLVYERRLAAGRGSDLYGLEVCQALGMPGAFMRAASSIRRALLSAHDHAHTPNDDDHVGADHSTARRSVYNQKLTVEACAVCSARATEVHHIRPQREADGDGFIGCHHKNRLSNLAPLCDNCHHDTHRGKLFIRGYVQTSSGIRLDFQRATATGRSGPPSAQTQTQATMPADTDTLIQSAAQMKAFGFPLKKIVGTLSERYKDQHVTPHTVKKLLRMHEERRATAIKAASPAGLTECNSAEHSDDEPSSTSPGATASLFSRLRL